MRPRSRPAAADPERDEAAFDGELAARQLADGAVPLLNGIAGRRGVRVDHAHGVASNVALIGWNIRLVDRAAAKCRAFHSPAVVILPVPVFKKNVWLRRQRRGGFFRRAEQRCQARLAQDAIAQQPVLPAIVQTHGIFQLPGERCLHRQSGRVAQGELQNRRGQAGVVRVQWNEWRKRFELYGHRHAGIGVFHGANRVLAAKGNVGKTGVIKRANILADCKREFLVQRRSRNDRPGIMLRPRSDGLIEDVPMPEAPIAAQIELSRADAANGHADKLEITATQNLRRAAVEKRFHPFGPELLVGGHEMIKVRARERPGHHRQSGQRQTQRCRRGILEKLPAVPVKRRFHDW